MFVTLFVMYYDHRKETFNADKVIGRAKYKDFIRRFNELKGWNPSNDGAWNIYLYKDGKWIAYVGQSKVSFNKRLMLFGPIDYFRVRFFVIRYLFKLRKNSIPQWEDVEAQEMMENITGE